MADYTLSAKITGDAGSFKKACADAKKTTEEIKEKVSGVAKTTEQESQKASSTVKKSLGEWATEHGKTINEAKYDILKLTN